ncbi:MAG: glycosyltransferase family 2 protein [Patescibacteria group bacterium]
MDTSTKSLGSGPLVSVLMLTYNRADFIGRAIESVLAQTLIDWELIIVDDGSTDTTADVVARYSDPRIRYIPHRENEGVISRRNESVRIATGTYLAVLDSDDVWTDPVKLRGQVAFLEAHPDHVLVGTQAMLVHGENRVVTTYPTDDATLRARILSKNLFINSSCMWRRDALPEEAYRAKDYLVEDYSLWLRLGTRGKFANLPECMTQYTIHAGSQNQQSLVRATACSLALAQEFRGAYPHAFRALWIWRLKLLIRKLR